MVQRIARAPLRCREPGGRAAAAARRVAARVRRLRGAAHVGAVPREQRPHARPGGERLQELGEDAADGPAGEVVKLTEEEQATTNNKGVSQQEVEQ